jgi:hypothetical protein
LLGAVVHHARRHSIGYLALTLSLLALGGASYAAVWVGVNAVGEPQIRNHAIDPIKLDPTYIAGSVRRWASVSASGQLLSSANLGEAAQTSPGVYVLTWQDAFVGRCVALATVQAGPTPSNAGGGTTTTSTTTTSTTTPTTTSGTTTTTTSPTTTTSSTPPLSPSNGAFADTLIVPQPGSATLVRVSTYNWQGQPTPEPFSVAVVCPAGAGSGQTFPVTLP